MPSSSSKQHRFMEAVAHNPAFAKKAGVPQSVGKDFAAADKGKKFVGGGSARQKINMQDTRHGAMDMPFHSLKRFAGMKSGGKIRPIDEEISPNFKKGSEMDSKMMRGSMQKADPRMAAMRRPMQANVAMPGADGGMKFAKGGGIESKGKTVGKVIRMASGGSVSSRADGIVSRGKTKCTTY